MALVMRSALLAVPLLVSACGSRSDARPDTATDGGSTDASPTGGSAADTEADDDDESASESEGGSSSSGGGSESDTSTDPPEPMLLNGTASTAACYGSPPAEAVGMAIDGDVATKFLAFGNSVWMRVDTDGPHVLTHYAITSANDAPERDPVRWILLGSNNGSAWTEVDLRTAEVFASRNERREFTVDTTEFYRHYLLRMENASGGVLQIAELELHGWSVLEDDSDLAPAPAAALTATAGSRTRIDLAWEDTADDEAAFRIERSDDGVSFIPIGYARSDEESFAVDDLLPNTSASFRVVAQNGSGDAGPSNVASATTPALVGTPSAGGTRYEENGYAITVVNLAPATSQSIVDRIVDEHLLVYPMMAAAYNPAARTEVTLTFDPAYDGVAAAGGTEIVISSTWIAGASDDIDVITHEGFHLVQAYNFAGAPGWATEGLADFARYTYGEHNSGACWSMQRYEPGHAYTDAYGVTARFLLWIDTAISPGLPQRLDMALRAGTYTDAFWATETGQSVDDLWLAYAAEPMHDPVDYD
jgi:hypothetical protein